MAMAQTGFQGSFLGNQYQFSLLLLCAHRAVHLKIHFELQTEQEEVGKFDDIVLKVSEGGTFRYVFGQAKHKQKAENLKYKLLMPKEKDTDKNFQLSKYFESWLEILNHFHNSKSICIMIITNNRISTQNTGPKELVKVGDKLSLYFTKDTSKESIFINAGERYKFPDRDAFPDERQAVFQILKNDFTNKKIGENLSDLDFDNSLNSFMDQLVFVTSLDTKDIYDLIEKDLQQNYRRSDVSIHMLKLHNYITDSFTSKNNDSQKVTENDYKNVLTEYQLFESKLSVMEKTSGIFDDDSCLEFEVTHKTIEDFLDLQINSANNILQVKTQESETEFVSMQIYKKLSATINEDTYIMMKTSFDKKNFNCGVEVFDKSDSFKFMIIEVDSEDDVFEQFRSQLDKILRNSSKRMIVITDVNSKIKLGVCLQLVLDPFHPNDLKEASLARVSSRQIKFQKCQTTWKELAEVEYLKNSLLLKDLLSKEDVAENVRVSKDVDKKLYVSRNFIFQHWLKTEKVLELQSDVIASNQKDYEAQCKSKNIHWLENTGEHFKWIKSSKNISRILTIIEKGKKDQIGEGSFAASSSRVPILIDVAGMGKSIVLDELAQLLKKTNPAKWIVKIDLNDYTNKLEKANTEELKTPDGAIKFIANDILELATDFEKKLFKHSCISTGNVILLFDGFDEVASYYKDEVTQLIKFLLETSIERIFIASRPECTEYLETTFLQIKYSLMPFEKKDQEIFLFNYIMQKIENVDENLLKEIVEMILVSMSKSLKDEDYQFTGVPLITKLVAEFFESEIRKHFQKTTSNNFDDLTRKLKTETFNLIKLYDHFVEKKLRIYYEEKCKMDLSNARIKKKNEKERKMIRDKFETLAVQQILKTDLQKHLPSFEEEEIDEDDLEEFSKVGLMYEVNKEYRFSHQTYGEFGFNKFLDRNFDDEDCCKFIVEVVLVHRNYEIIRAFMNFWILDKVSDKTCESYREKLLANSTTQINDTPLLVANREKNENIFRFLYSSLARKTGNFDSRETDIQNYLLKLPYSYTVFARHLQDCDDDFNMLSELKSDFGIDMIRELFTIEMNIKEKLLHTVSKSDKNIIKVFQFLRETFSGDLEFLRGIFLATDKNGQSFLHIAFYELKNETLLKLLDELDFLKDVNLIDDLILINSNFGDRGVFLSHYAGSKHFHNDSFFSFLDKLKLLLGEETLKAFFLVVHEFWEYTLLHCFCLDTKIFNLLGTLEWISDNIGDEFLVELITKAEGTGQTILHFFTEYQLDWEPQLLSILKFLKSKFTEDLISKVLFGADRDGESVFTKVFSRSQQKEFWIFFFDFLTNDLNLNVKQYSIKSDYLLYLIVQNDNESVRKEIIGLFERKFGESFFSDHFYSAEILHKICDRYAKKEQEILNYFDFVGDKNNLEFLKEYISQKNSDGETILYHFLIPSNLIQMLEWLDEKFNDKTQLENFLMQVDQYGDSFLGSILQTGHLYQIIDGFLLTSKFLIGTFDKAFALNFLLLENNQKENCVNLVCKRRYDQEPMILHFVSGLSADNDFVEEKGSVTKSRISKPRTPKNPKDPKSKRIKIPTK